MRSIPASWPTPFWSGKEEHLANVRARTPTRRNCLTHEIVDASVFFSEVLR